MFFIFEFNSALLTHCLVTVVPIGFLYTVGAETMFWQISKELGVNQQSRALVDALSGLVGETLPERSNNLKSVPIEIL